MVFFHQYFLIFALCTLYVESANPIAQFCNEFSYTITPELSQNIDSVLAKLIQNTPQTGFNITDFGDEGKEVNGIAQCRGDVPSQECTACLQTAAKEAKKMCPNQVEALIWYEYCFLRYGTRNLIEDDDMGFRVVHYNVEYVTNPRLFKETLTGLFERIRKVPLEPNSKGFGKGEVKLSDSVTLYVMIQCTRESDNTKCERCLSYVEGRFKSLCEDKKGCRIIYSMCYVRYELYSFFFGTDKKLSLVNSSMANYVVGKP
ncbi:putative Gnk2-like domain-containing protein [Helianthus annuus]|uniref:Gnk2-like domain-containing protein n=1 Tax=Helianthus annuus TaxID=4232 RepID=A0A251U8W7_HELAN|nr:cysteine-rich repeat secretory protein 55 [Helianthus annuus]KAF5796180.1 putative Gnk2-like domain-containing protein [Helianthus annuus]KAJ0547772.1 putative Gnk2-like domain-containing protein [Helianthus annuus]KAJ0554280.1 putative Gnk2-like domain-containing protein [Helianthus annuus]KAJ0902410.1 putative Gnk2-like domain-containing protein [Helianthus annuus]